MKYKKALVTGGAGFIGSHIAKELVQREIETIVIDNLSMGRKENVPEGAKLVIGDILKPQDLRGAMRGVDIVFHNAAKVSIRNSFANVYNDVNTNIMGTINVLQSMAENKVKKIICASSMAIYGPNNKLPISEDGELDPISPYGISKLAMEKYCLRMGEFYKFDAVSLRYFNTYGIGQTLTPYVGVITIFIQLLLQSRPPVIFGDGKQVRDFIAVEDVARANILAMEVGKSGEVFNIGTGKGTSINEIAQLLIKHISPRRKPQYGPLQPGEPGSSIAAVGKAKEYLNFQFCHQLQDKIDEIIAWNKKRDIEKNKEADSGSKRS